MHDSMHLVGCSEQTSSPGKRNPATSCTGSGLTKTCSSLAHGMQEGVSHFLLHGVGYLAFTATRGRGLMLWLPEVLVLGDPVCSEER